MGSRRFTNIILTRSDTLFSITLYYLLFIIIIIILFIYLLGFAKVLEGPQKFAEWVREGPRWSSEWFAEWARGGPRVRSSETSGLPRYRSPQRFAMVLKYIR